MLDLTMGESIYNVLNNKFIYQELLKLQFDLKWDILFLFLNRIKGVYCIYTYYNWQ